MVLAAVNLLCHHFSRTNSEKKGIKYLYILRMNLQRYDKEELYPTDFTDDDKLNFDIL